MADNKKMVEAITSMDTDFAQWYTDVVKKAELCDYASVKGCMVIKPAGYAIWENIQKELDRRFKETGVYVDEIWARLAKNQPQRQVQERFREYIKSKEPSDPMHQLTARDRMTRRYHPS